MISRTFLLGFCALFAAATAASKLPHLLGTCDICAFSSECASGRCWGFPAKCIESLDYDHLIKCGYKPECGSCITDVDCATVKCWSKDGLNKKCTFGTEASKHKCFATKPVHPITPPKPVLLPECSKCSRDHECSTGKCWGPPGKGLKCTYETADSRDKCFPPPKPVHLPLCAKCTSDKLCASGKCWGGKCVASDLFHDLIKCDFLPECALCHKDGECATKKCWGPGGGVKPKCTFDTPASQHKCFPPPLLPDCSKCSSDKQCKSGKCWSGKCVASDLFHDLIKCDFLPECALCHKDGECATKKCWGPGGGVKPKCTFDTPASQHKCFPPPLLPDCSKCSSDKQCKSGKCWSGKCVASDLFHDLIKCDFLPECALCHKDGECATKKCWGPGGGVKPKCTFDTPASQHKCFPPPLLPDCSKCSSDKQCKSGKCWSGKCVASDLFHDLIKCDFLPECALCHKDGECATKKCWGPGGGVKPKCTFETAVSQKKCFPPIHKPHPPVYKPSKKQPPCGPCSINHDCISDHCFGGKCVFIFDYAELTRCGLKVECAPCSTATECATKKCWGPGGGKGPKCTFDTDESRNKCFY